MFRKKIMIVDDDKVFLEEFEKLLSSHGYQPFGIHDSTKAIDAVNALKPDLILLDIKMKDINGFQIAHNLKSSLDTASIPIIAITGYFTLEEHSSLMKTCGMHSCIQKPFDPVKVISKIEATLNNPF